MNFYEIITDCDAFVLRTIDEASRIFMLEAGDRIWGMMYKMLIGFRYSRNHKVNKGE